MSPHVRVTAAILVPLMALAPSCVAPRREVHLQFTDGETVVHVAERGGQPIQVPEPELWGAFRVAARAMVVQADPLAAAEQTYGVAEGSGTYWYYARSGRLVPESGVEVLEDSTEQMTRGYLGWCGGTRLGGGDCLHLLGHTKGLSLHGRYVVTLVMSMTASFGPMLDSLKELADPDAVAVMLASAVAMYLLLLLVPEPITKLISLSITAALIGYLGLQAFWDLVYGWRALAETVDVAADFSQLQGAARDFAKVLGPQMGQLLILLVSHSLGKGIAASPRFAEASAQGRKLLRLSPAGAAAIQSVTIGSGVITVALATSAMAVSAPASNPDDALRLTGNKGRLEPREATEQGTASQVANVPGRVQSRINLKTRGWEHVLERHYSGKPNVSQFTIPKEELGTLLQSKEAVATPVTRTLSSTDGIRYVREFNAGRIIGVDKFAGNAPTRIVTILTDLEGNLVTASPGIIR